MKSRKNWSFISKHANFDILLLDILTLCLSFVTDTNTPSKDILEASTDNSKIMISIIYYILKLFSTDTNTPSKDDQESPSENGKIY